MNRNIVFRGKRPDDGKWIYGWLFQDDDDHLPMIHHGGTLDVWEQVEEETVGQFTGLCDAKGIDIYDGDILHFEQYSKDYTAVVKWNYDVGAWCMQLQFCDGIGCTPLGEWLKEERLEVIGTIYDNPDLLKKEE